MRKFGNDMKITANRLRKIIVEELRFLYEAEAEERPGQEKAEFKGTLDVKKITSTLGIDNPQDVVSSISAAKKGQRSTKYDKTLADMMIKLLNADPNATVTVTNVLKKVEDKEGNKEKKEVEKGGKSSSAPAGKKEKPSNPKDFSSI